MISNYDSYEIVVYCDGGKCTHEIDIDCTIADEDAFLICKGVLYENNWTQVAFIIKKNGQEVYSERISEYSEDDQNKFVESLPA